MKKNRWLSVDEIAKHVGVAKPSVNRSIAIKGQSGVRVGQLWTFKSQGVSSWVECCAVAEEPPPNPPFYKGRR